MLDCYVLFNCSDDCEQKNWTEIHKFHCDALMKDPRPYVVNGILKSDAFSEEDAILFHQTFTEYACLAQDFDNLQEIVNFYTKDCVFDQSDLETESTIAHDVLIMVSQILLGKDENAYIFAKQLAYGETRDSKSLEKDILKEDFLEWKNSEFISNKNSSHDSVFSIVTKKLFFSVLIAIKINVIEDMKFRLTQYEAFHRKMKKKFWPHPRIINIYTLYILGKHKESFLKDLEFQEKQVEVLLIDCQTIIHSLVLDCLCEKEEKYCQKSFLVHACQGLQDHFKNHSYARNYILDFYKSIFSKSYMKKLEKNSRNVLRSLSLL